MDTLALIPLRVEIPWEEPQDADFHIAVWSQQKWYLQCADTFHWCMNIYEMYDSDHCTSLSALYPYYAIHEQLAITGPNLNLFSFHHAQLLKTCSEGWNNLWNPLTVHRCPSRLKDGKEIAFSSYGLWILDHGVKCQLFSCKLGF